MPLLPLLLSLFFLGPLHLTTAISITSPTTNTTYAAGSTTTITWNTVDTDPAAFSLYLVNFVDWPPSYVPLALDIKTSERAREVQIPCDTNPSWGYQVNAINGTNVYVIYAQSGKVSVSRFKGDGKGKCVDTTVTATNTCPLASASVSVSTATVYVTVGSFAPSTATSSVSVNSSSSSTTSTSTPSTTSSKSIKPGLVPKTIGWKGGYDYPVTIVPPTPATATSTTGTTRTVTSVVTRLSTVVVECS